MTLADGIFSDAFLVSVQMLNKILFRSHSHIGACLGLEVIKLEFILKLKIKRNDWLLADTCPQATNHCTLFQVL